MDNKTKKLIQELNKLKGQLSERFVFGDEGPEDPRMHGGDEGPDPRMFEKHHSIDDGDSEEEIAMHAQEVIEHEPIIGKIRETAIEGLKKYSDHPTSEIYNFFKKVFLDADKVLTSDGKGK